MRISKRKKRPGKKRGDCQVHGEVEGKASSRGEDDQEMQGRRTQMEGGGRGRRCVEGVTQSQMAGRSRSEHHPDEREQIRNRMVQGIGVLEKGGWGQVRSSQQQKQCGKESAKMKDNREKKRPPCAGRQYWGGTIDWARPRRVRERGKKERLSVTRQQTKRRQLLRDVTMTSELAERESS